MRCQVEEAALDAGLKGARTPREGDLEFDRIGYLRKSLTERERKELRIRREKRNSPEGVAFAEIRKREENSRADEEEWSGFNLEGEEEPIIADPGNGHMEPLNDYMDDPARETNSNASDSTEMAMNEIMNKMQEIQEKYDCLKASQEAAEAAKEDAEDLSPKMNQKSPEAEIPSPKMEQKSKSF